MRALDGRLGVPAGRYAYRRRLLRQRHTRGAADPQRSPTSCIAAPIGDGRSTAGRRSRTATSRNRASSYRWEGYDEALLLYVLGLGSPTYPLPEESYQAWLSTYVWKKIYDYEFVYAGPLFIHQLSHIWVDFRGIQDAYMRDKGLDYFENSRRATYVQREYAIHNPLEFALYDKDCWGITASDGPGPATLKVDGVERQFFDYVARGVPHGPDDGTIAPWAVVASLPFAPEIVLPAIRYFTDRVKLEQADSYGFKASFNPTYPVKSGNP